MIRIKAGSKINSGEWTVSRLAGLVSWDGCSIMGLLLEYIDNKGTLADLLYEETSKASRQQWIRQIQDTIGRLHAIDVT